MKKLIALIFFPILVYGQGITQSQTIVLPAQALRDSLGVWVTVPAGRSILAPLLAPSSGTSGYWARNANAGESATISPVNANDTTKSGYFKVTTAILNGAGTVTLPSYTFSANRNTGLFNRVANEINLTTNGSEIARFTSGAGYFPASEFGGAISITNGIAQWGNGDVFLNRNAAGTFGMGTTSTGVNAVVRLGRLRVGAAENTSLGRIDIENFAAGTVARWDSSGNLGIGSTTPLHRVVGVSSFATNLNGFNFVNSDFNTNRSTVAQAQDTSSAHLVFTGGGSPVLTLTGKDGSALFIADSAGVRAATYKYNTSIFSAATADGSDNSYVGMAGGGSDGSARGATIYLSGNERVAFGGELTLSTGNTGTGTDVMIFKTGASIQRMRIDEGGVITLGSTDSVGVYPIYTGQLKITTGSFIGNSAVRDTSAFVTTAVRQAIYIAGATSSDFYIATPRIMDAETLPTSNDVLQCWAKTDSLIVNRPASGTSGLKFTFMRMK